MPQTLRQQLRSGESLATICTYLDALPADQRETEVNGLGRADQAALFERAADGPDATLDDFVPGTHAVGQTVHHPGRNTIGFIRYFQHFEKRFSRSANDPNQLFGYNVSNASFVRPGYFVAYETQGRGDWEKRGGVVIDYHQVPEETVPDDWPQVVTNDVGLQKLVYFQTRDFMRKVSEHVTIGRASKENAKGDRLLDFWFTLCRKEMVSP